MSRKTKSSLAKPIDSSEKKHWMTPHLMFVIVAVVILFLYGRTINYGYTVDDGIFIQKHEHVQQGIKGIPAIFSSGSMEGYNNTRGLQPYRPLTLTTFAIDKEIAGDDPTFGHLVNVLIYLLLALVLIQLLGKLIPSCHPYYILTIALLYFVHPSHIEVVANIKSRDELLAAFFGLLALNSLIDKKVTFSNLKTWVLPFVFFILSLFSKESIITIVPISFCVYVILRKWNMKDSLFQMLPMALASAIFLLIRQIVLPQNVYSESQRLITDSTLFGDLSFSEAWGTRFVFLAEYLRILVWPLPLSWDYSYNQLPVKNLGDPWVILSIAIHAGLLLIAYLLRKKSPLISFGILFYFLAFMVTNNILIIIGANVAERLLLLPSLGYILFLVAAIQLIFSSNIALQKKSTLIAGLGFFVFYCFVSIGHIPVWQSNYTLFKAGAESSPNSSRANIALATVSRELASNASAGKDSVRFYYQEAIKYYNRGLAIYDGDKSWNVYIGMCYLALGDTSNSISSFVKSMQGDSSVKYALHETARLYGARGNFDSSIYFAKKMVGRYPEDVDGYNMLTGAYFGRHSLDSAILFARQAFQRDSTNVDAIRNLVMVNMASGNPELAAYFEKKLRR
jgi:tetratricopeptide (TPR) repeat protein